MSAETSIILGSRGSELARRQTAMLAEGLRHECPNISIETTIIKTRGDERINPLAGRKGLFTGEIERALVAGEIDMAVHSAKDLPSDAAPGLELRTLPRALAEDVLIRKTSGGFAAISSDAVVATGSVRRQYQLRWQRPGLKTVDLRGNVPTRLRNLLAHDWDAIVLARAGLDRLGFDFSEGHFDFEGTSLHVEILSREEVIPAGGQGIIAMQLRSDDARTKTIADAVNDADTLVCLQAEREFLRLLHGDCNSPVGVLATIDSGKIRMRAQIFEPGKPEPRQGEITGVLGEGGARVAARLMEQIHAG